MPLIISLYFLLNYSYAWLLQIPTPNGVSSNQSKYSVPDWNFGDRLVLPKFPRFAYLISGTNGEGALVKRLLQAVYHPRNYYLLHLDLEASDAERLELRRSEWVVLTRSFLEFCVWGWDNLPRTLLMYYANFLSSPEGYFHTLVCNHKDYQNTTVNNDLHYIKWDNPPKQRPISLALEHFEEMVESGAPFAREFAKDPVLNKIDEKLLRRSDGRFTPGGWCVGNTVLGKDPCVAYGSPNAVKPTVSSKRLEKLILALLDSENFRSKQCK
ncbi:hypothetical protein GH714_010751 [Hevea brasiliensis]|uniref:Uncharacterized protein n=1 Tax=Hevea brasiliensis TaxID=3981 RepID=A0A6A6KIF5_HEVBR|nr:hypothetical protein GH714_010751 [Hevea brasiliensis]